jgi:hypothetical protein
MIDELAYAGPEHLGAGFVAGYDRMQGTDPAAAIAALRRHGFGETSTLVTSAPGPER